jgi:hypothetical protein
MNLAQASDVESALGRELEVPERARTDALIAEASDLVLAWCRPDGTDFGSEELIPGAVTRVTARVVARVIASGADATNMSAQTTVVGPFQRQTTFNTDATGGGPWLTRADKMKLRPYRHVYVQNVSTY